MIQKNVLVRFFFKFKFFTIKKVFFTQIWRVILEKTGPLSKIGIKAGAQSRIDIKADVRPEIETDQLNN